MLNRTRKFRKFIMTVKRIELTAFFGQFDLVYNASVRFRKKYKLVFQSEQTIYTPIPRPYQSRIHTNFSRFCSKSFYITYLLNLLGCIYYKILKILWINLSKFSQKFPCHKTHTCFYVKICFIDVDFVLCYLVRYLLLTPCCNNIASTGRYMTVIG